MTTADDAMRLQRFAAAELDLTIDDALLRLLLNFLQRHEREHEQRLTRGYRTALGKKGDADRIREARKEAAALRNASMRLRDLLKADRSPSGMDWAFELRANCIVSSLQNPVLGSELELAVWRQEVSRLLDAFVDLAEMRTGYFNNDASPFEAELPKQVEAAFAQGLAWPFRHGGRPTWQHWQIRIPFIPQVDLAVGADDARQEAGCEIRRRAFTDGS